MTHGRYLRKKDFLRTYNRSQKKLRCRSRDISSSSRRFSHLLSYKFYSPRNRRTYKTAWCSNYKRVLSWTSSYNYRPKRKNFGSYWSGVLRKCNSHIRPWS